MEIVWMRFIYPGRDFDTVNVRRRLGPKFHTVERQNHLNYSAKLSFITHFPDKQKTRMVQV